MASVVRDTSESKASLTAKVGFIKGRTTLRLWMTVTAFAVGVCAAASAFAQGYPAQPVRVIVPFAKGGGVDVIARLVSQKLSELWGQRVTVESHPGAGTILGVGVAAKSPPDGYTLLVNNSIQTMYAARFTNLTYDPVKDFVPVAPLVRQPYVLVVGKPAGVNTVAELIAAVKAKPGELKFGGFAGSQSHLGAEKFNLAVDIKAVHVPAPLTPTGRDEMIADTIAGRVTYLLLPAFSTPQLRDGRLIALAVTSARRSSLLPEIPTVAEAGPAGFEYTEWYGMWAPAGTPAHIVDKIGKDVARALTAPDLRAKLAQVTGMEPMSMAPAEFARFVASESESAAYLIKVVGITPEVALTGAPATGPPTGGPRPAWQQNMDEARRVAATGNAFVLRGSSGVLTMYNNPRPFCYMYMIPGDWVEAEETGLYRSKEGPARAGVAVLLPRHLEKVEGKTLVERARNDITQVYEKARGRPLAGVKVAPFESARTGTWKWTAAPATQGHLTEIFPSKIIVDLSPNAIVQITVGQTPDDDGLARRIIESLKTTSDPQCYWADLERELRSGFGDR